MTKRRSCQYKRKMTKDQAYTFTRESWEEKFLIPYKCAFCKWWHVARHKPARVFALFEKLEASRAAEKAA